MRTKPALARSSMKVHAVEALSDLVGGRTTDLTREFHGRLLHVLKLSNFSRNS